MKFKDYIVYWYNVYRKVKQAPTTIASNISSINNHIVSAAWAQKEVGEIETREIQEHLTELLLNGNKCKIVNWQRENNRLSTTTVRKVRQMLISCFKQAVKEKLITSNPAEETEPIPPRHHSPEIFTVDAQQRFLAYTRHHRFYVAYVLLFYTGCRRGEILGLSWDNVHWRESYISIRKIAILEDNMPVIRERTKTIKSERVIPIPKEIKELLHEVQRRQRREKLDCPNWSNPYNLVFTNKNGSIYHPNYFSRNFKNALIRLGLSKKLHCHCTRHSWATNMIQIGIPITDVQAIGGWARPDILLNIYAHAVHKTHVKAMQKLYKNVPLKEL